MARTYAPTPARPVATLLDAHTAHASSQQHAIPPLSPVDEDSLADSLHDLRDVQHKDTDAETPEHPFANTNSLITIIHDDDDEHIDLEAERAFYGQFPGFEDAASVHSGGRTSLDGRSLFSAEIVLGESLGDSDSKAFARDVRISGWTTVGRGNGAYVVYDCVITTKENLTIHALKRYSAFEKLASGLRRSLPRHMHAAIPRLPPKNPLAKHRPAFLERRRKMLQAWLLAVLLHPVLGGTETARAWVLD
ncbi:hypothetical protein EXIGLDRAFT_638467 [Exidia glandulosa HHB12029]|uniref:Endosomal/vacuolar adapter protein YPT35 n=1 Tax=Exidia glandulosa HHB12029 TaxID=1314781 RepID=A0A165NSP8_EXIGL|nr:hypothetical protein EXIGLDRAFT_638467 [Exidia glandulosa HHB12029]